MLDSEELNNTNESISALDLLRIHLRGLSDAIDYLNTKTLRDELSQQQGVVSRLIPDITNILLAIESLLSSGYLFPSELLVRGALDRLGTVSFMVADEEKGVRLWQEGWIYRKRPQLRDRLQTLPEESALLRQLGLPEIYLVETKKLFLDLVSSLNGSIHGDYGTAMSQITKNDGKFDYYWIGPNNSSEDYCNNIAAITTGLVIHLAILIEMVFPEQFLRQVA